MSFLSLISCAFPFYGNYEEDNDHDGVKAYIFDITCRSFPDEEEERFLYGRCLGPLIINLGTSSSTYIEDERQKMMTTTAVQVYIFIYTPSLSSKKKDKE